MRFRRKDRENKEAIDIGFVTGTNPATLILRK
jgi:hypothetical protein